MKETPTPDHKRLLKMELERARSQLEAGVFVPRDAAEEDTAMAEDLLIDIGAAAIVAMEVAQNKPVIKGEPLI